MKQNNIKLKYEVQNCEFRKNEFQILYHYFEEIDTKDTFTTTELDELNINQVHNMYRQKYRIPFPDEIKSIREQYGLSATKMSKLLGFGSNQYRKYEDDEMPSVSNGKMIEALKDPLFFKELFEQSKNEFSENEIIRIEKKIDELIKSRTDKQTLWYSFIFKDHFPYRSRANGFASINPEKIRQLIIFFSSSLKGVFETKLNKLLFYSDFLSYKSSGRGITGLQYKAITFGPVPLNYGTIYENLKGLKKDVVDIGNGHFGSMIFSEESFDSSIFTEKEINIIKTVLNRFKGTKAGEMSEISHTENAWIKNKDNYEIIDYVQYI